MKDLRVIITRAIVSLSVKLPWLGKRPEVNRVENSMAVIEDHEIPLRIYTPDGDGPFPVIVFFHGSGFTLCSLDTHDCLCRDLCAKTNCIVVSVDYRLAPENKFPCATDDCYLATKWTADNIQGLGGDATKMFVVGDSAGGNMAAVTAQRVRDQGGPELAGQILIYPVTDYHTPPTASYLEKQKKLGLTRELMVWFWDNYLNNEGESNNPYASPLKAGTLKDLPKALVIISQFDPLRDEGERYADRLLEDGVNVERILYQDRHGFVGLSGPTENHQDALNRIDRWISNSLKH